MGYESFRPKSLIGLDKEGYVSRHGVCFDNGMGGKCDQDCELYASPECDRIEIQSDFTSAERRTISHYGELAGKAREIVDEVDKLKGDERKRMNIYRRSKT